MDWGYEPLSPSEGCIEGRESISCSRVCVSVCVYKRGGSWIDWSCWWTLESFLWCRETQRLSPLHTNVVLLFVSLLFTPPSFWVCWFIFGVLRKTSILCRSKHSVMIGYSDASTQVPRHSMSCVCITFLNINNLKQSEHQSEEEKPWEVNILDLMSNVTSIHPPATLLQTLIQSGGRRLY